MCRSIHIEHSVTGASPKPGGGGKAHVPDQVSATENSPRRTNETK